MSDDAVALAADLIRCRSVTPEDDGALSLIAGRLRGAGFAVEEPTFGEPGTPEIRNLFAAFGRGGRCLAFAGHTDVVPAGDLAAWSRGPFDGTVSGDRLYGRGAVDMKGAVAASVVAALRFTRRRGPDFDGRIAFILTGDEEGPAVNGTVKLLRWAAERGERFDACLLGEPTNPSVLGEMIKIGRRGSLTGRLAVAGTQGHVAYPHLVRNPIPILARIVSALADAPLDGGTGHFGPSTLQFTTVDVGNPATNVVPGEARAVFNIRFNDLWSPDTLAAEIRRRAAVAADGADIAIAFDPTNSVAFLTEPGPFVDLVGAAVEAETGRRPELSTTGGTSDARFIQAYCPVVEFGLVGRTMHATDEHAGTADIEALARIYERVLDGYFPSPS